MVWRIYSDREPYRTFMIKSRIKERFRTALAFKTLPSSKLFSSPLSSYSSSSSPAPSSQIAQVKQLDSWDLEGFRTDAFSAQVPAKLPLSQSHIPSACHKWFAHGHHGRDDVSLPSLTASEYDGAEIANGSGLQVSYLRRSFWVQYESLMVPLEVITTTSGATASTTTGASATVGGTPEFLRQDAPLRLLLTYLETARQQDQGEQQQQQSIHVVIPQIRSMYLAQCSLTSLPPSLQTDIPTPELVLHAGRGDIYDSSLWLGRSSATGTYTPLHRDPNPNVLLQLAGQKVVRLLPPAVGDALFDSIRDRYSSPIGSGSSSTPSASIRGDDMMVGPERDLLHHLVWGDGPDPSTGRQDQYVDEYATQLVATYGLEAQISLGQAIFIPKGWWHSVRGQGEYGVTASANWWFR